MMEIEFAHEFLSTDVASRAACYRYSIIAETPRPRRLFSLSPLLDTSGITGRFACFSHDKYYIAQRLRDPTRLSECFNSILDFVDTGRSTFEIIRDFCRSSIPSDAKTISSRRDYCDTCINN